MAMDSITKHKAIDCAIVELYALRALVYRHCPVTTLGERLVEIDSTIAGLRRIQDEAKYG